MAIAIYPGTFDPMTRGHEDIVRRAAGIFGRVVVGVSDSRAKTLFTLDERIEIMREVLARYDNVEVAGFSGLLRDFVIGRGARVVVRGVRAVSDFDYEAQLAGMNRHLMPEVETIFMTPADQFQFVSGTLVREIATYGGDVGKFVSPSVQARLERKLHPDAGSS
jgi:pantetheine-phosphate adenylyltransferase